MSRITIRNNATGETITGTTSWVSVQINLRGWTDWDICDVTEGATEGQTCVRPPPRPSLSARRANLRREAIRLFESGETVARVASATGLSHHTVRQLVRRTGPYRGMQA